MRRHASEASTTGCIVCPSCEVEALSSNGPFTARCGRCGFAASHGVLQTLREIAALPEPFGKHACECGHPEMRLLPGGVFRCPACGAEVLPNKYPRGR